MATVLEVQEQVSVSAPLALASCGVPDSGFPDSAQALHQVSALRVLLQIVLNSAEHVQRGLTGQLVQPGGKRNGFDVYHSVGYTTMWDAARLYSTVEMKIQPQVRVFIGGRTSTTEGQRESRLLPRINVDERGSGHRVIGKAKGHY